jgi:hypothetical protein
VSRPSSHAYVVFRSSSRRYKAEGGGDSARRNITILMKLLVAFQGMLTLQISGTNSGDGISFTELGGGAKITRIFKDKFALEMAKVDLDESELRREIAYAIRNLQVLCVCVCVCGGGGGGVRGLLHGCTVNNVDMSSYGSLCMHFVCGLYCRVFLAASQASLRRLHLTRLSSA